MNLFLLSAGVLLFSFTVTEHMAVEVDVLLLESLSLTLQLLSYCALLYHEDAASTRGNTRVIETFSCCVAPFRTISECSLKNRPIPLDTSAIIRKLLHRAEPEITNYLSNFN